MQTFGPMENPFAAYATAKELNVTELAEKLGFSVPYTSQLCKDRRGVSVEAAKRLAALTGRPWHEYMDADAPAPEQSPPDTVAAQ